MVNLIQKQTMVCKETYEVAVLFKDVMDSITDALKDGKFEAHEIPKPIVAAMGRLDAAVKDIKGVGAEFQEHSALAVNSLTAPLLEAADNLIRVLTGKEAVDETLSLAAADAGLGAAKNAPTEGPAEVHSLAASAGLGTVKEVEKPQKKKKKAGKKVAKSKKKGKKKAAKKKVAKAGKKKKKAKKRKVA